MRRLVFVTYFFSKDIKKTFRGSARPLGKGRANGSELEQSDLEKETNDSHSTCCQNTISYKKNKMLS